MSAPEPVRRATDFAEAVDAALPGRLTGLYLVGSAALGDWQEHVSNIDAVAVADRWDDAALTAAVAAHPLLGDHAGPCRVAYVTYEQLAGDPGPAGPACFEADRVLPPGEFVTPLTWRILAEEAIALRGPEYFPVGSDGDQLRAWAADRLAGRWATWAGRASHRPAALLRRRPLAEALLEVTRLHVAATQGRVVSKLRSGSLVLDDVAGRYHRVVTDAAGYRQGSRTSMYWGPIERKHHAVELVGELTGRVQTGDATEPAG